MKHAQKGFSLVQMSVILTVVALGMVTYIVGGQQGAPAKRTDNTLERLDKIQDAMQGFKMAYGRLPCPADGTLAETNANFGKEAANNGSCTGGAPAANFSGVGNVVAGVVPTKALQISDELMLDGYGRRISYVADERATETNSCSTLGDVPSGNVLIDDGTGSTVTALAALISHGQNGHGAFSASGNATRINSGSTDTSERDNASVDAAFATSFNATYFNKERTSTYDDYTRVENTCCQGASCDVPYTGPELVVAQNSTVPQIMSFSLNRSTDTFTKMPDPNYLTNGSMPCISDDANYMMYSPDNANVPLYKRTGNDYTNLDPPAMWGGHESCAFSPNGATYVVTAMNGGAYFAWFKRSGDTFTALANPATVPAGTPGQVSWSGDSVYLAVPHANSPFVTVYKRTGDTLTKLANPATLPTQNGYGASFTDDGVYLAFAGFGGQGIIYKRSADVFTKLLDLPSTPAANGAEGWMEFSPDSIYLAFAHYAWSANSMYVYKRNGDAFSKLPDLPTVPSHVRIVSWSGDSKYLALGHANAPYITIYKRNADVFTKLATPAGAPAGWATLHWSKVYEEP